MKKENKNIFIQVLLAGLQVAFVTLKLAGKIDWSWWWVFGPLWIPFVLYCLLVTIALIAYIIKELP